MKSRLAAVFMVIALVVGGFFVPGSTTAPEPAQAVEVVNCTTLQISSDAVRIRCTAAGIVVLNTVVDLPAGPTVEVTVTPPQVTVTETVRPPQATQTIEVPVPGPTQTETVTATVPGPTSTATVTSSPTGQVDNGSGTVDPSPSDEPEPEVITLPGPTTVEGAVLGGVALLILAGLILLALFLGYWRGYREADSANASWMKRLLIDKDT